jgi:hypothetical protein
MREVASKAGDLVIDPEFAKFVSAPIWRRFCEERSEGARVVVAL